MLSSAGEYRGREHYPLTDDISESARQGGKPTASGLGKEEAARLTLLARVGMVILAGRTVVLQVLVLAANVYLARVLDPGDFGIFAIVQFVIALSTLFGDAGLGGALIQQKHEPSTVELSTVFWVQTAIVTTVMAVVWVGAPWAYVLWPKLPAESTWLLRALTFSLLFSFLRAVPAILMERALQFGRLSAIEILNSASFYLVVVVLASLGMRVWSLVIGVVVQSFVALVATFIARPWKPRLAFDRSVLQPMFRFGLPFQAKGVIAFANEAVMPLFAGAVLGQYGLGLINWGRTTAYFPLKLVEIVGRVSFPLYSRLRSDRTLLTREIERNVRICLTGTMLFVSVVFAIGPALVRVIYGEKWIPALPALYVFSGAITIGFLSPIIGAAFDAIGEPQIFVRLSVFWTAVNWISVTAVTLLAPKEHRQIAFTIGYAVHVVAGNLAVVYMMRKKLPDTNVWPRVRSAAVATVVAAATGRLLIHPWIRGVPALVAAILACSILFAVVLLLVDGSARKDLEGLFERWRRMQQKRRGGQP